MKGKAIRFAETDVRAMGRTAKGVRGMRVSFASNTIESEDAEVENDDSDDNDDSSDSNICQSYCFTCGCVPETGEVLCACANGYGKRYTSG